MNKVLWLMVAAALVAFACGGGGGSSDRPDAVLRDRSADEVAASTLAAMRALESYHQDYTLTVADNESGWELDYAGPGRYRYALFATDAEVFESIVAGDAAYLRTCVDIGEGCGDWDDVDVPQVFSIGPSASYSPEWLLVAIEQAEFTAVTEEDGRIRLSGSVNHLRSVLEHQRRIFTEAGVSFGEECTDAGPPAVDGEDAEPQPTAEPDCRELTFEDLLEQQAGDLTFYDGSPSTIDVWVDGDSYVERMEIRVEAPPNDEAGAGFTVFVSYSDFNEIEVEAPE